MILFEHTKIYGWDAAIRGMRNPMNSWDRSDTVFGNDGSLVNSQGIGENDYNLMKRLADAGQVHGKYLRMITVTTDITAPLYWWKEFDTYKVGTVSNSCSTMHKIAEKEFTLNDFSHEHLEEPSINLLKKTVKMLNIWRNEYTIHGGKFKNDWWQMIQLLPSSYNQRRTIQLNYAVLKNIYPYRKDHKLDEWRDFCDWIKRLPYSELITREL